VAIDARLLTVRSGSGADEAPAERIATLFDAEYGRLCRLAFVFLGDAGRAEEVVQEAFLRTFSGWGRLRDPAKADRYLRRAVVNLSRSRLRRRAAEGRSNATVHQRDTLSVAGDHDAEDLAVVAAVRALPTRQRAAVVLHYFADLAEAEVAATLGCSVGTVKSQLSKARATLARGLADDEGNPS